VKGIGEMARASGLSVSALRFYDTAGVLRPARVDPVTGYRWYAEEQVADARLVAALRRVQMPLDHICAVLADRAGAPRVLDAHLRRLEDGLADARRQLSLARTLLEMQEVPVTRLTVDSGDLAAALASVRYAAGRDPALPALCGVLFDFDGDALRLVATDRYRLAAATVPSRGHDGPPVQAIAPLPFVDRLAPSGAVSVALDPRSVAVGADRVAAVDATFPDYRRFIRTTPAHRVTVAPSQLSARLAAGPTRTMTRASDGTDHEVSVLRVEAGSVDVIGADEPGAVGVNREFLLEALAAGGPGQVELALDGPIEPLVVTAPSGMSLLMPVALT
jgi:DNA-binding transcriptional MerR regulator